MRISRLWFVWKCKEERPIIVGVQSAMHFHTNPYHDRINATGVNEALSEALKNNRGLQLMGNFFSATEPVDMEGDQAQEVKTLISSDDVVIFSKTYCPYCTMAKKVFDSINKKYTVIELDKRPDGPTLQAILGELTGAKTVPRVFVKGKCIGGGSDVKELHENGQLMPLLA